MSQSSRSTDQDGDVVELKPAPEKTAGRMSLPDARNASEEDASAARNAPAAEIELKLLCDPERLADLTNFPAIAQYARDEGKNSDLTAVYYDTPDLDLRKSGAVLRVRTDGKHFVMTLKFKKRGDGKALERMEWKAPVQSMEPDLPALAHFLPAETFEQIVSACLQPVFKTEVRRHTRMLDIPLGTVELAVDRGRIIAGEHSEEISEIELELTDGSAAAIFQLAQNLASTMPLRPSIRSKPARGYDLALDKGLGRVDTYLIHRTIAAIVTTAR